MFRDLIVGGLVALALAAPAAHADETLGAVVAGSQRSAEHKARDGARHPTESLVFWGLKPGQTVVEVSPGSGYWTEILAPYALRTGGRYVAAVADTADPQLSEPARRGRAAFEAKYAASDTFGPITYVGFGARSASLGAPGSADMVLTARNIHNWMWQPGLLDKAMGDFFAVLKPGGVLAVEEHRADPRPQKADARDGYVAVQAVVDAAARAGFVLDGQSEINANPKDTKDHPFGVWTLPPVRQSAPRGEQPAPGFDRARYDAIGESDRMTLRFRKPG